MEPSLIPPDGITLNDWLVRQTGRTDDVGTLAKFLLDGRQGELDLTSHWVQETLTAFFAEFNRDTEGQLVLGTGSSNWIGVPQDGLIALVRSWVVGGAASAEQVTTVLEHLKIMKELLRLVEANPDRPEVRDMARKLSSLL